MFLNVMNFAPMEKETTDATKTKPEAEAAFASVASSVVKDEDEEPTTSNGGAALLVDEDEVDDEDDDQMLLLGGEGAKLGEDGVNSDDHQLKGSSASAAAGSSSSLGTTEMMGSSKPKRKKAKGRNGNIYIGVTNRIEWFRLQEKFGFDNVNLFGNFVMNYMEKVYSDFDILHEMTVKTGLFDAQGLAGFKWVNGMPNAVDASDNIITLPVLELSDEVADQGFKIALDMVLNRNQNLGQLQQQAELPTTNDPAMIPEVVMKTLSAADDNDNTGGNNKESFADTSNQVVSSEAVRVKIEKDLNGNDMDSNMVPSDENAVAVSTSEKEALEDENQHIIQGNSQANQKKQCGEANEQVSSTSIEDNVEGQEKSLNLAPLPKSGGKATPKGRATKRKPAKRSTSSRKSAKKTKAQK